MSVDAAWRYTIGTSNVVLAILDDGIEWTNRELRARLVLNPGELQKFQPNHADQSPCAPLLSGDPNSPRFDCALPPDGVVTVEDYAEKLGWTSNQPQDPNDNGILDPGDIVLLNQNKQDDDGNGLVDDIAGWDFIDNDSIPNHGNTRHGTEVALDALAQTGDSLGRAGACPRCVGLALRVADQRGSDPQRLALAIVYAASRGATVALVGHSPIGRSETLEHAMQYAAQRGMLVLFPTDGEQQIVSSLKFDSDAWLPLSVLTTRGDSELPTKTTSFVALDPCQAFPAGPLLAASGPACSRRAYSTALGIAGLVASAAKFSKAPSKLTPLELAASLRFTSDPINMPEDNAPSLGSVRRINANSAVELVRNGLAPAELNVERPYWHEALALDRIKAQVEITGRLAFARADSLDLSISAAEGRSPHDASFQTIYTKKNWQSPGSGASSTSTLAAVDLRAWYELLHPYFDREPLVQSLVSLRIRATSHYASAAGDRVSEAQVDR
ncbi:MAG TPA: S8 family serine peptidase, partial [Polyangiaceae bacterium]